MYLYVYIDSILPKGPYPPCLRMADRALLAGFPRYIYIYGHIYMDIYTGVFIFLPSTRQKQFWQSFSWLKSDHFTQQTVKSPCLLLIKIKERDVYRTRKTLRKQTCNEIQMSLCPHGYISWPSSLSLSHFFLTSNVTFFKIVFLQNDLISAKIVFDHNFILMLQLCYSITFFESTHPSEIKKRTWQSHAQYRVWVGFIAQKRSNRQDRRWNAEKTLGHLRSINGNMIIHFANQSQTCQLLKILKNIIFSNFSWKETVKSGAINHRLNWYRKSISIIKSVIYI